MRSRNKHGVRRPRIGRRGGVPSQRVFERSFLLAWRPVAVDGAHHRVGHRHRRRHVRRRRWRRRRRAGAVGGSHAALRARGAASRSSTRRQDVRLRREADMQARPSCVLRCRVEKRQAGTHWQRAEAVVRDTRACVIRSPLLAHGVVALLPPAPAARAADEAAGAKRTQVHALGLAVHQQLAHRQPRHRRPQNALEE